MKEAMHIRFAGVSDIFKNLSRTRMNDLVAAYIERFYNRLVVARARHAPETDLNTAPKPLR